MKKAKTVYVCQSCGSRQPKWVGRCPDCNDWNTLVEEAVKTETAHGRRQHPADADRRPLTLGEITGGPGFRMPTGMEEMDRVLGGGIVPGSLVLIGGDPGIGKSTLLLQLSASLSAKHKVLYVSGEESAAQIKMRAERLGVRGEGLLIFPETNVEVIVARTAEIKPALVVIDSIQTVYTELLSAAPGSVGQLRESAALLMQVCKRSGIPVFLVGHVTKDGSIAGPRVLEHMVDTVLYFEGDRDHYFRVLRSVKNRFGSTHEIGVFEMAEGGLKEVRNPSEIFIAHAGKPSSGAVVAAILSGTRPILVELQALVTSTSFGNPRRTAVGIEYNRVVLLAAILQKRAGIMLDSEDIYAAAAGGVRVDDPGADLAIAAAIVGSFRNRPSLPGAVFIGEVGLGGEVRPAGSLGLRLKEAARMGLKTAFVPEGGAEDAGRAHGIRTVAIPHIAALSDEMF